MRHSDIPPKITFAQNRLLMRVALLPLFALFFACQKPAQTSQKLPSPTADGNSFEEKFPDLKHPKNIVLLIGDGMGLCQITASMYSNGNRLHMERLPVTGVQKTHSKDNLLTDSAAAGTAMACGTKTSNKSVGVFSNGKPATSILQLAENQGLASGLVVTSSITHATPAAFFAHVENRSEVERIAEDFLKTDIDLFIGGGKKNFESRKNDTRNLVNELTEKGYALPVFSKTEFKNQPFDASKPLGIFTDNDEPASVLNGRDYLPDATRMAADFLKKRSSKGFFCMIEGSQIDWAAHDNDLDRTIAETLDFDRAVGQILDWAEADGETLVIVTADHETGGLSINQQSKMGGKLKVSWSTMGHTGVMVPVFAKGPGAELFGGIYDNTAIFEKMKWLLKL